MVLLVKNTQLSSAPDDLAKFYSTYPHLLQEAKRIASKIPIKVDTRGVLYVRQKQWAATHPGELLDDGQVRELEQPELTLVMFKLISGSYCLWYRGCTDLSRDHTPRSEHRSHGHCSL